MLKNDLFPLLFACVLPVKGASRAMLCDIQRSKAIFIPLKLADILLKLGNYTYAEILKLHRHEFEDDLADIFKYFEKNEYVFFTQMS